MSFPNDTSFNSMTYGEEVPQYLYNQQRLSSPDTAPASSPYAGGCQPLTLPPNFYAADYHESAQETLQQHHFNQQWESVLYGQSNTPYIPAGQMSQDFNNSGSRGPTGPGGQNLLNPVDGEHQEQPPTFRPAQEQDREPDWFVPWRARQTEQTGQTQQTQQQNPFPNFRPIVESYPSYQGQNWVAPNPYSDFGPVLAPYSTPNWVLTQRTQRQDPCPNSHPAEQSHPQAEGIVPQQTRPKRKKGKGKQKQQPQQAENLPESPERAAKRTRAISISSDSVIPGPEQFHLDPEEEFVEVDLSQFTNGLVPSGGLPPPGWKYNLRNSFPPAQAQSGSDPAFAQLEAGKFEGGVLPEGEEYLPIAPGRKGRRGPIRVVGMTKATGPMSRDVYLPPLAKPGRRATDPPPSKDVLAKRREQNRIAQRSFRDKRDQKLADAHQAIEDNKREYEDNTMTLNRDHQEHTNALQERIRQLEEQRSYRQAEMGRMQAEMERMRRQMDEMSAQIGSQTTYIANLEQRLSLGPSRRAGSDSVAESVEHTLHSSDRAQSRRLGPIGYTPPVDFTSLYSRSQANQPAAMAPSLSNQSSNITTTDRQSPCGFCRDQNGELCECAQQRRMNGGQPAYSAGNCESCRADPARAQQCRDLARQAQSRRADAEVDQPMSCATFFDQVTESGTRIETVSQLLNQEEVQLSISNVAGFELNEQEAARVLQSISKQ